MFRLQSGAFAICESLLGMRVRLSHRVGLPQQVAKEAPPLVVCCWNIRLHHQHSPINFPVRGSLEAAHLFQRFAEIPKGGSLAEQFLTRAANTSHGVTTNLMRVQSFEELAPKVKKAFACLF